MAQPARAPLIVNGRFRSVRRTGVQRVAAELAHRLATPHQLVEPTRRSAGLRGYVWEQLYLPTQIRDQLLWSPCNVGPVTLRNQVVTIHDAALIDHPEWFSPAFVIGCRAVWLRLIKVVRQIVTVSAFSRRRLSEAFDIPERRIEVVPNAVDARFRPLPAEASREALLRLGLPDAPYFATLSTLEPRKNLRLVLAAWEQARGRLPRGAQLLIVGGRGAPHLFNGGAAPLAGDGVRELGFVDDALLPAILSGAMGVVYPSLYEGFGLPLLEAMACGAPVVTARNSSLPEVAGEAAAYVDPHHPEDLARVLVRLAESPALREDMGAASLEGAARFSWERSADRLDDIFRRFI